MYHKIETNDDGDVSMKHVVIHIKGGNSRLADFNQMSNMLIKPKTSQVYFQINSQRLEDTQVGYMYKYIQIHF